MTPVVQLSSAQQQFIIEAAGKEQAMGAVLLRALPLLGLSRLSRNIRDSGDGGNRRDSGNGRNSRDSGDGGNRGDGRDSGIWK